MMEPFGLAVLGLVAALGLWAWRRLGVRIRWPIEHLVRDHTAHLNCEAARRASGFRTGAAAASRINPSAAELERRGYDPDGLVVEFFAARDERRAADFEACRRCYAKKVPPTLGPPVS